MNPEGRQAMTTPRVPSVGRDVHYMSRGSADGVYPPVCRAAKVTEVGTDGRLGLVVLNPDGVFFHPLTKDGGVHCDDRPGPAGGTWHWPERDDEQE
jgi:hypothetical protein